MTWSRNGLLPARTLLAQLPPMDWYCAFGSMKAAEKN